MTRNLLIYESVALAIEVIILAALLMPTEAWGLGMFFMAAGILYLWGFIKANEKHLLRWLEGKKMPRCFGGANETSTNTETGVPEHFTTNEGVLS